MTFPALLAEGRELSPDLVVAAVCAVAGAGVLTRLTRLSGIPGFVVNAVALFAGAQAAKFLLAGLPLPFDYLVDRAVFVSVAGMLVASFAMLMLFPGSERD